MIPSDPAERHRVVAGRFGELVRAASAYDGAGAGDPWLRPAPVDGWTAGDVVDHLTTWLPGLLQMVGHPLPERPPAAPTGARQEAWQGQVAAVQALLDDPASAEVVVEDPRFPTMTLTQVVDRLYTTDVFMHTWDLARALGRTGPDAALDADHCEELFEGMQPMDEVLRASGQYGARVPVPDDAPAQDRLLGFIGRDPAWAPGQGSTADLP